MTLYDLAAPLYGIWAALVETRAHRAAAQVVAMHPGHHLLEVAVGPSLQFGMSPPVFHFLRVVGIDLSMPMLKRARRHLTSSQAWLCQADARALPFGPESFDAVLNCFMIDLLSEGDIPVVLQEFSRVLRSGGRLVLLTMAEQKPAFQWLWMALYRRAPFLVGGCRPLDAGAWLRKLGWKVEQENLVSQMGFRSMLTVAQPPPSVLA